MTRRSGWMLLLCVFIAGVFFGIWMDWSAHKHLAGGRDLIFEVQDYPMANLQVNSGDKIWLVPPPGGNGTGLLMDFVGYNPCKGTNGDPAVKVNPCVIDATAAAGPYLFTCSSGAGYTCPEPGVQQQPTGPIEGLSYPEFVKTDFTHLIGMKRTSATKPEPSTSANSHPNADSVTAYVSCQNGKTVLQDPNGKDSTTITASVNRSVYWISPKPFSLDLSSAPAGFCTNGNPTGGGPQPAQCDLGLAKQTVQYKVQALTSPACSALPATLITK